MLLAQALACAAVRAPLQPVVRSGSAGELEADVSLLFLLLLLLLFLGSGSGSGSGWGSGSRRGAEMARAAAAVALLCAVLSAWEVCANEDCLWYVDRNGTWHNGFDCPLISFCCGNCHRRYCCLDGLKMITEGGQKRCMLFHLSPSTIAGIASSILLFVAAIATMVCCFMCSCCYLYQRHQQRGRSAYEAQQIPMASYPVEPMYNAYGKPIRNPENPGYPMAPQYPGVPPQYPMIQGPYPPYTPADPGYSQGAPPPYSPPQYPGH